MHDANKQVYAVKNKDNSNVASTSKTDNNIKSTTNLERIIEAVREKKCLWNSDIPVDERSPKKKIQAWQDVFAELGCKKTLY